MSILDENSIDNLKMEKENVPVTIELLHKLGWRFVGFHTGDVPYPDISQWPVAGRDPWNPYWVELGSTSDLIRHKLYLSYPDSESPTWNPTESSKVYSGWEVSHQPEYVEFEYNDEKFYLRTWSDLELVHELIELRKQEHLLEHKLKDQVYHKHERKY